MREEMTFASSSHQILLFFFFFSKVVVVVVVVVVVIGLSVRVCRVATYTTLYYEHSLINV
jgi:hypothetical protein